MVKETGVDELMKRLKRRAPHPPSTSNKGGVCFVAPAASASPPASAGAGGGSGSLTGAADAPAWVHPAGPPSGTGGSPSSARTGAPSSGPDWCGARAAPLGPEPRAASGACAGAHCLSIA